MNSRAKRYSLTDVLIEVMPFSVELAAWCRDQPSFRRALKFSNDRFLPLGAIRQRVPTNSKDKIIGFYVFDLQTGEFKQDYIVDKEARSTEFHLYTVAGRQEDQYVKHINDFANRYTFEEGAAKGPSPNPGRDRRAR